MLSYAEIRTTESPMVLTVESMLGRIFAVRRQSGRHSFGFLILPNFYLTCSGSGTGSASEKYLPQPALSGKHQRRKTFV